MKKYWKIITLALFSIIVIGGFYLRNDLVGASSPEYTIETRSGDKSYIESMVLLGNVNNEGNMYWDFVQLSTEGTKTSEDFSFNEQLDYVYGFSPEMQKMYNDYPDFLRNKSMSTNLYYEDEAAIVFANIHTEDYKLPYEQMEIAVLDKGSNEEKQIIFDIPEYDRYEDFYIENVQKNGEEVMIFTVNYLTDQQYAELHVYRVNLENGAVVEDQIIQPSANVMGADYSSILLNTFIKPSDLKSERYMIYESNLKEGQNVDAEDVLISAYDTTSGNMKELAIPSELQGLPVYPAMTVHESSIYFTTAIENGFEVSRFDIEMDTVAETQFINLPNEVMKNFTTAYKENDFLTYIEDSTVYYVSTLKDDSEQDITIVVGDLETGQVLYDGKIVDGSKMSKQFKDKLLNVDSLYFR